MEKIHLTWPVSTRVKRGWWCRGQGAHLGGMLVRWVVYRHLRLCLGALVLGAPNRGSCWMRDADRDKLRDRRHVIFKCLVAYSG